VQQVIIQSLFEYKTKTIFTFTACMSTASVNKYYIKIIFDKMIKLYENVSIWKFNK